MLRNKKILIGITGSIAAYKTALLIRLLIKEGAEVKVIMTESAQSFITGLTISTLAKNEVYTGLVNEEGAWQNHVQLGRWANLMVIAPLSCNTLAKMAHGLCDNMLMATYLSATCKVMVAPAMDEDMWKHPSTKKNLETIASFGNIVLPVEEGELASGLEGPGRMAEPELIVKAVKEYLLVDEHDFLGKKVLVTAGPTYEPLDPVRFIGNHSSGKMGAAIAEEFANRGAKVTLVAGPGSVRPINTAIDIHTVQTAKEMYNQCMKEFSSSDITVMAAAVADYTPTEVALQKIKKDGNENLVVQLEKTKDILKSLGEIKKERQLLIGFALESHNEKEYALKKLAVKNADMIVLNSLNDKEAGFGKDTNKVTLFERNGKETTFPAKSKQAVAKDIVDKIKTLVYA